MLLWRSSWAAWAFQISVPHFKHLSESGQLHKPKVKVSQREANTAIGITVLMLSWIATSVTPSCNVLNLNLKCWKILGSQGLPDPFSAGSCISWFVENENNGIVTYFSSVHFIRRASQQCCQKQLNTCSADLLSHSADSCRAAAAAKQKNKNNCESRYMFLDLKDLRRISTLEDSPLALDCTAYQDNDRILITAFSAAGTLHHESRNQGPYPL